MCLNLLLAHVEGLGEAVQELNVGHIADHGITDFLAPDDIACDEINVFNLALIDNRGIDCLVLSCALRQLHESLPAHLELRLILLCLAVPVRHDVGKPQVLVNRQLQCSGLHGGGDDCIGSRLQKQLIVLHQGKQAAYKALRVFPQHLPELRLYQVIVHCLLEVDTQRCRLRLLPDYCIALAHILCVHINSSFLFTCFYPEFLILGRYHQRNGLAVHATDFGNSLGTINEDWHRYAISLCQCLHDFQVGIYLCRRVG